MSHRVVWPILLVAAVGVFVGLSAEAAPHSDPRPRDAIASPDQLLWPSQGQAAVVAGSGPLRDSPGETPVPIASVAKVMTGFLALKAFPMAGDSDGFTYTVTWSDASATRRDAAEGESFVDVRPGETLTERQMLEALLIPSGNNIARMLATQVAGGQANFVADMNAEARAIGMPDTNYTDPSGFDPGTVSTAADQLKIFTAAMRLPAFATIVSMPSVTLPVAGTVANFDPLIDEGYVGKTGSDEAAGGCLAFSVSNIVAGQPETVTGVVLGQGEGDDTADLLAAAGRAAEDLVQQAVNPS